ncbi:MAG: glycoside hydrolase family 15 protein, partial [Polyangia bacterium]
MDGSPYAPIADYALIGDCHGAALIRRDGSIDWACLKRFDAGSFFGRMLDAEHGGSFRFNVPGARSIERRYLPDTNVLETTFVTKGGTARLYDCFTMRVGGRQKPHRQLLRIVEGVSGEVDFEVRIDPRFDYGSLHPWLHHHQEEGVYTAVGGDDAVVISTDCPLDLDHDRARLSATFRVKANKRVRFSLTACPPHQMVLRHLPSRILDARLASTIRWWENWVEGGTFGGPYREQVVRSALVLKLLTCAPTGAIIAAPTTSLPESLGGARNWDYRFSWVRDSTLTLAALLTVGRGDVAHGFKLFIERATAGRVDELQIMYGCYGERRLPELELSHLSGYRDSRPVRVGNSAATQTQLDVYGELLDAAHLWSRAGNPVNAEGWRFLHALVEKAAVRWREPDQGLWESRGAPQHFVYSKAMCWLAIERGLQTAEEYGFVADRDRWRKERDEIRASIEEHGVDPKRGCFVQAYGSKEMDASLLRLPLIGFVEPCDPRMIATVREIRKALGHDGMLRRYRTDGGSADGLKGGEGCFVMASFWLIDVLTMQGEIDEAERLFGELLAIGNDLGLYSEEYAPEQHLQLGNFPQAFSHVALIVSAEQLRRARGEGGHQRAVVE